MIETVLLFTAFLFYLLSFILQLRAKDAKAKAPRYTLFAAALLHLALLAARSLIAKHPPFTNIYETFLLLPFLIALRLVFSPGKISRSLQAILTATVGAFLLLALFLPADLKVPKALMPALNSPWMYIHVPAYFFAYMALIVGVVYAVIILTRKRTASPAALRELEQKMDAEIRICFFFLNLGLITGAIWAYISWGNYWSWDPKETWALINIFILAFVMHLKHPTARKKAWILVLTVISVAFTYWVLSFILSGLHSYT
ncbi:MAG: cytochrome c biogenesis protein CcsA [Candidatus Marinimicrobia bacterium]|nr:cytochrome c biogenesis protein CcsA [Candidatus Neomarinimicrobiota bacterium]